MTEYIAFDANVNVLVEPVTARRPTTRWSSELPVRSGQFGADVPWLLRPLRPGQLLASWLSE